MLNSSNLSNSSNVFTTLPHVSSKKEPGTRKKELLEVVSPPLLEYLRDNAVTMVMDKGLSVIVRDILLSAAGDLRPAMQAVAKPASLQLVPGGIDKQVGRPITRRRVQTAMALESTHKLARTRTHNESC